MTPQEFDVIRAAIKSAYPTFNIMPDRYSIQLWYRMLGDIDFKICETALQELIATQTYPPQIAEIRAKCAEYTLPQIKDAGEAWGEKVLDGYCSNRCRKGKRALFTEDAGRHHTGMLFDGKS